MAQHDKKVIWMLNELDGFEKPKIKLEQYATSSELAVSMMEMIDSRVGLTGRKLIDIGCGTGMLMTSAGSLYDVAEIVGVDVDPEALTTCRRNLETADILDKCRLVHADILDVTATSSTSPEEPASDESTVPRGTFHIALINPPFGTKNNAGIDMKFVEAGLEMVVPGGHVFSLHKTTTRDFILKTAKKWERVEKVECCAEMRWNLPATYKFHKQKAVDIAVDLMHFQKKSE